MQNADIKHIYNKPTLNSVNILKVLYNFVLRYMPEEDPLFVEEC